MLDWLTQQGTELYKIFRYLLPAVPMTIYITVLSFVLAALLGMIVAVFRVSKYKLINRAFKIYTDVIRGIPLIVQIFFIYFSLGNFFNLDRFYAGVIAISICYSAYLAEIIRAGIGAVPKAQLESALSLGMSRGQAMRYVILPQANRMIIPPVANEFIAILKDSSLVSIIGLRELTRAGREYYMQFYVDSEVWFMVGVIYLAMTLSLSRLVSFMEKKFRIKGYGVMN
ncbi:MAG: amino acid ABC transporter permease [candidate division Zixibacteria bacterium]|nr:amino acid ABC transporter permease [candidate division Zixibacteria bacterium]